MAFRRSTLPDASLFVTQHRRRHHRLLAFDAWDPGHPHSKGGRDRRLLGRLAGKYNRNRTRKVNNKKSVKIK